MAFPQVSDADTKHGDVTSSSSSWSLTYPTNIAAGDLLLILAGPSGNPTPSATGWTVLLKATNSSGLALDVLGKVATGSETGSFTLSMSGGAVGGWRVMRITAWFGGTLTAGTTSNASSGISAATTTGTSTSANPPSLTPAWGSADDLWFAIAVAEIIDNPLTGTPTSYANAASDGTTTSVVAIRHSRRELTATSDDPSTYTSANDLWVSGTLAIRPAAIATNAPAGNASGTGAANNTGSTVAPSSANASATGATNAPTITAQPNAGAATATGAANAPSATIKPVSGVSTGTGAAGQPSATVSFNTGIATGTGAAANSTVTVAPSSGVATGTGAAGTPRTSISGNAAAATGTVSAFDGSALVMVSVAVALAVAQAFDATVSTATGPQYGLATYHLASPQAVITLASAGLAMSTTSAIGLHGSSSGRMSVSVTAPGAVTDTELVPE